MDLASFFNREMDDHIQAATASKEALGDDFCALAEVCVTALQNGRKILFFGNGGSAADAQHIATELTVRYTKNRPALAALSLATDSSALTAIANDFSYDEVFSRQIEALGNKGDVALGISTSGNSKNVNLALERAKEMGLVCTGWAGKGGGEMKVLCDPFVLVPSDVTARIQEVQIILGHMLCGSIEQKMELV